MTTYAPAPRHLTPAQAAALRGLSERTVQRQLAAAETDEHGRVVAGPWAGAWRRGTYWRIPASRVTAVDPREARLDRLQRENDDLRARLHRLSVALSDLLGR